MNENYNLCTPEIPEGVFFAQQKIRNACGTFALIHSIAQNCRKIDIGNFFCNLLYFFERFCQKKFDDFLIMNVNSLVFFKLLYLYTIAFCFSYKVFKVMEYLQNGLRKHKNIQKKSVQIFWLGMKSFPMLMVAMLIREKQTRTKIQIAITFVM